MESKEIHSKKKFSLWAVIVVLAGVIAIIAVAFITATANSPARKAEKKLSLAERYMTELNYAEAIVLYNEILEIDPKNIQAYKGLFDAYIATDDEEKARETVARAESLLASGDAEDIRTELRTLIETMQATIDEKYKVEEPESEPEPEPEENLKEKITMNADGSYTVSEFNDDGDEFKRTYYDVDGNITYRYIVEYETAGKISRITGYLANGTIDGWGICEYDEEGNYVQTTVYYSDGDVQGTYAMNPKLLLIRK